MVKAFDEVDNLPIISFFEILNKTHLLTEKIITDADVQNLLKSDQKFDLVISEISLNEATLGECEYFLTLVEDSITIILNLIVVCMQVSLNIIIVLIF
jgi:uncharacterized protein (DUF2344 family)